VAQKFHFAILRIEVTRASRGLSAIAELLVTILQLAARQMYHVTSFDESQQTSQVADRLHFDSRPNNMLVFKTIMLMLVHGQVTIIFVMSVGLSVCLCRAFLSRL